MGDGAGTVGPQIGDGKPSVLLFFAKWCTICRQEVPTLAEAEVEAQRSKGPLSQIQVIGVDPLDSPGAARLFIEQKGTTFPVGLDTSVS